MKTIIPILCLCLYSFSLYGQNYFMSNAAITSCEGVFYDSGGFAAPYSNDEDFSTTICSDGTDGTHISLLFNEIDISPGDLLCFYDGNGITAPQLTCILDYNLEGPFVVQTTESNLSGCLTVTFSSNSGNVATGWSASIACSEPCQSVLASLENTNPPSVPLMDGWIDICPGEIVTFTGTGTYPNNGLFYNQSDNTSTFSWDFGDGTTGTGKTIAHQYNEPGGYIVQLVIEDANACKNINFIQQRVRVAPPSTVNFVGDIPNQICLGETITLNSNLNSAAAVFEVNNQEESFFVAPLFSDTLFVPDGLDEYETSIQINQFTPGQLLTDIDDLQRICMNIEHSYLFDLGITITCPSGNTVTLQNHEGFVTQKINLGEPVQNLLDPCDNTFTSPGVGYDYCFENFTGLGTMTAVALALENGATLPSGSYDSYGSLSALLGCPLNGVWTISVTDNLACDNGWMFSWEINFDENLYPNQEVFSPEPASWEWVDDMNIAMNSPDFMIGQPTAAGTATYEFEVTDEFGCSFYTNFDLNVLPSTHPQCYACSGNLMGLLDTTICQGEEVFLDTEFTGVLEFSETFRNNPKERINSVLYPPTSPFTSKINVTNIFPTMITDVATTIESLCINFKTDATGDMTIDLQAPSGQRINLVNTIGGQGDNFTNTCFSPTATNSVTTANPPYSGNFLPMGNWSDLNGATVNGFWNLIVSDAAGETLGIIEDWTIVFNIQNELTYSWSNPTSVSCADCADAIVTPTTTTTYTVEATDLYGCTISDQVTINVIETPADIDLVITEMESGIVSFRWDAVNGATGYEVNIDNMGWVDVGNVTTGQANGYVEDQMIHIQVRPYSEPIMCNYPIAELEDIYSFCFLAVNEGVFSHPTCFGYTDGVVSLEVLNGEAPYAFSLNGDPFQELSVFQGLPSGSYTIVATDNRACVDSIQIDLVDPSLLEVTTTATMVTCFEGGNGQLEALATGGTLPYMYTWNTFNGNSASVENLEAGIYQVVVSDANFCAATTEQEITEPNELNIGINITETSCYGGADGGASILVAGGTPSYSYNWTGGLSTTAVLSDVSADTYFVTVTDANACTNVGVVQIEQPVPATAQINPTDVSCFQGADGMASVENTGQTPYTYFWDDAANSNTQTITDLTVGSYSVTMTDGEGCQSIGITNIGSPAAISLSTAATPTQCVGTTDGAAMVSALGGVEPFNYQWENGQTMATATALASAIYEVTVTDANNCTATTSVLVTEAEPIELTIDNTPTSCDENMDGTTSVMAMGGADNYSYQWDDPTGQVTNTATNLGIGAYTVTVTDANNCTAVASTVVLTENPIVIDTLSLTMGTCAADNSGTATIFASGGVSSYMYNWSDANMQLANPAVGLAAGTYTVTITDQNNCSQDTTFTITEPDAIQVAITTEPIACFGSATGTILAEATGGTGTYTYQWNDADAQTDSLAENLVAGIYTLTLTDENDCTATSQVDLTEPSAALNAQATQTYVGCYGYDDNIIELTIGGGDASSYMVDWDSNQTGTIGTNLAAGMAYYTITDASDCVYMDSILVEELTEIIPNVAFAEPTCYGYFDGQAAINFIEGGAGSGALSNYTYEWGTSPIQVGPVVSGIGANQSYFVTVTDALGCQVVDSIQLTQPQLIEINSTVIDVACFGEANGQIEITEVTGDNTDFTYEWSSNVDSTTTTILEDLDVGTYNLTVTDTDNCSVATSLFITEPNPISIELDSTDNNCFGESEGLITTAVYGGISPYSYFWSSGTGSNVLDNLSEGIYIVTVQDANACTVVDSIAINDPLRLEGLIDLAELDCFEDSNAMIDIIGSGGTGSYQYSLDGSVFGTTSLFTGLTAGDYPIQIVDALGCQWDTMVTVVMPEPFELEVEESILIEIGESIELTAGYGEAQGVPIFEWSSSNDTTLSCTVCPNPIVSPLTSATYEVFAIDSNGCMDTEEIRVSVGKNQTVLVPTGFTPNGDGLNDLLLVHGKSSGIQEIKLFRIYDRWGDLVYERENFSVNDTALGWDGRFREKEMPTGVYVWLIEAEFVDGIRKQYQGHTNLLR